MDAIGAMSIDEQGHIIEWIFMQFHWISCGGAGRAGLDGPGGMECDGVGLDWVRWAGARCL